MVLHDPSITSLYTRPRASYNEAMKLKFVRSTQHQAHLNLAIEQALMKACPPDTLIFYLWQNAHTVVIGKHQHAPSEIHMENALNDGVTIARRGSGGGAVYHDLGNLNFTFIAQDPLYDIPKQMAMIAQALVDLGIEAKVNGRNDIEVEGFKVSGNAFAHQGATHLHHGTLLVNVDKAKLGRYLNVNPKKLKRKQVASVAARVANLTEFKDVTLAQLTEHLFRAVEAYANTQGEWLDFDVLDTQEEFKAYSDPEWILQTQAPDRILIDECFDFGCLRWHLTFHQGIVTQSKLYSDTLDNRWLERLEAWVLGCEEARLVERLAAFEDDDAQRHLQIMSVFSQV